MHAIIVAEKYFRGEPISALVPDTLERELRPGCMVLLSAKKGSSSVSIGYIISLSSEHTEEPSPIEILDVLYDGRPVLNASLLQLTDWMADYYLTRRFDTLTAALPAAVRTTVNDVAEITDFALNTESPKIINTKLRRSIMQMMIREKRLTVHQLQRRLGK